MNAIARSQFAPLWLVYRPGPYYPNAEVAERYYGRSWHTFVFEHEPDAVESVYAAVGMTADGASPIPRAYHFAYRRANSLDRMWRPYGTVVRFASKTILASESGDYQEDTTDRSLPETVAETYFGDGAAEFTVASLHPFSGSVTAPSGEHGAVRFWA